MVHNLSLSITMKHINSYPLIYKTLVCEYYSANRGIQKIKDIIKIFKISNGTLYNWVNEYNNNELKDKLKYIKLSKFTPTIRCYIRAYVLRVIAFDYKKLINNIKRKYLIDICKSSLYNLLSDMNITRKKFNKRIIPKKSKPKPKITNFKKQINTLSQNDIMCIDEPQNFRASNSFCQSS